MTDLEKISKRQDYLAVLLGILVEGDIVETYGSQKRKTKVLNDLKKTKKEQFDKWKV